MKSWKRPFTLAICALVSGLLAWSLCEVSDRDEPVVGPHPPDRKMTDRLGSDFAWLSYRGATRSLPEIHVFGTYLPETEALPLLRNRILAGGETSWRIHPSAKRIPAGRQFLRWNRKMSI